MALINCPECGREVSDRAEVCIHCGYPLQEVSKVNEEEKLDDGTVFCCEKGIQNFCLRCRCGRTFKYMNTLYKRTDFACSGKKELTMKVVFPIFFSLRIGGAYFISFFSKVLSLVMKHAVTYRQLKPVYDRYRQSKDKEKFLRGHESEIILFEAAARELKKMGAVPLPSTESMKTELDALAGKKDTLLAEYRAARSQAQEYETIRKNVDALLSVPDAEIKRIHLEI